MKDKHRFNIPRLSILSREELERIPDDMFAVNANESIIGEAPEWWREKIAEKEK
ncbi:MAG: hypothetical protein JSV96_12160 [Candidatus Aminicenantes bacterium]|nr:MAG: hypothetical protein JSV96_12160 [Candidatus Aminicenantes bacterium]